MRLITYRYNNLEEIGFLINSSIVYPLTELGFTFNDMNDLIKTATDDNIRELKSWYEGLENRNSSIIERVDRKLELSEVTLLSPIPRPLQDVLCVGINYYDHSRESKSITDRKETEVMENPIYFSKRATYAIGDKEDIDGHFDMMKDLDYEVELAVIISKDAYNIEPNEVEDYIFGYTIMNDVTSRDMQTKYKQWFFSKSLDTFTVLGPSILTADELPFPLKLNLQTFVNDELRQNSNTDQMIFDISYIVSDLSKGMTLKAGTIISTGTPSGVGMGFSPPKYLKKGDNVQCIIEKIGTLTNKIS